MKTEQKAVVMECSLFDSIFKRIKC